MSTLIAAPSRFRVRPREEVAKIVAERGSADYGFLNNRLIAALVVLVCIFGAFRLLIATLLITVVLIADFLYFFVHRENLLDKWGNGEPRQRTVNEFLEMTDAFSTSGLPVPTMSDFEEVTGASAEPEWRTDLRYENVIKYYKGGVVADIGCGDGRLCWHYDICPPELYYGVDAGSFLEKLHSSTGGRAHALNASAEETTMRSESVDYVVCTECFEHLIEPSVALREFNRILRPGGRIIIQSPSARFIRNLNPFRILTTYIGKFIPAILLRTIVHPNTFVDVYTYHWDFTRQDFDEYLHELCLKVEEAYSATYRFNPRGSLAHRVGYAISQAPIINSIWADLTVVLVKR